MNDRSLSTTRLKKETKHLIWLIAIGLSVLFIGTEGVSDKENWCPCNSRASKPSSVLQPILTYRQLDMAEAISLEEMFKAFSKFGDTRSDGQAITLTQSDKWMKQATVIDGKKITTTDTGIAFNKFRSKSIQYTDYVKFLEDLATTKKIDPQALKDKLVACGMPGTTMATQAVKVGAVDRLTDTSKYTGAHKQRFDESGKGKGIEGREDVKDNAGYVQGYKEKDTYDAKRK